MSHAALEGKRFASLTVLSRAEKTGKNGGLRWLCRCDCGREITVLGSLLVTGRKQHCGCKTQRKPTYKDIAGKKFGRLTALYPAERRRGQRSVMWHCRCDCGREVDALYNDLVYTALQSCGCQKREHDEMMPQMLTHVAGTSVDMLRSTKIPKNNTTGAKGVYLIRGKYVAKIVFQKKPYYLGAYSKFEDALEARREAEEMLNEGTVRHYEKWKARADADPEWGKEHPIEIVVRKQESSRFAIDFLPDMAE